VAVEEHADEQAEISALRARVAELEHELAEQSRTTNALVAKSQERLYWYDRWGIDLERVMSNPGAESALELLKKGRSVIRWVRKLKRKATAGTSR